MQTPKTLRVTKTDNYNWVFNPENGFFARWGTTEQDDPDFSPLGPEILDIEISTICHQGCSFCYKSNTGQGQNMSLETFQAMFAKFPRNLTQIAFGIGSIDSNPDLWAIMNHCRENGVIPNITINGARMTAEHYQKLVTTCGAVAVSNYGKDQCYNAVLALDSWRAEAEMDDQCPTLKQVNIHQLLAENTYDQCMDLLRDVKTDPRLKGLNAVVFLLMKPKGARNHYNQLRDLDRYKALVDYAMDNDIAIGFDSCSAPSFLRAVKGRDNYESLEQCVEPCESTCFSLYIDTLGNAWPCSFCADEKGFEPVSVIECDDFLQDIWNNPEFLKFRDKLIDSDRKDGCRSCPAFDLEIR